MKNKIYVAGHRGMAGSAICRLLNKDKKNEIITRDRKDLDLKNQADVNSFFATQKPNEVYIAAAKVGGILANNTYPAEFIYDNLMIELNLIHAAFNSGVKKLLFLGSSCIYPRNITNPIKESDLLTGPLESTNEPYAIAKIAGIKLCESYNRQYRNSHGIDYRSIMPTNLYGPGDNYHPENSHVVAGMLRRFHEAKCNNSESVVIWGTGSPLREFLYVDDLAEASVMVMNLEKDLYDSVTSNMLSHLNVGYGKDISISELANIISKVVGYKGRIVYDTSKPDGTPRKLMDTNIINKLGWSPRFNLEEGLRFAYEDYKKSLNLPSE